MSRSKRLNRHAEDAGILTRGDKIALVLFPLPFTSLGITLMVFGGVYVPEPYILCWAFITLFTSKRRLHIARSVMTSPIMFWVIYFIVLIALFGGLRSDSTLMLLMALAAIESAVWSTLGTALVSVNRQGVFSWHVLVFYTLCALSPFFLQNELSEVAAFILISKIMISAVVIFAGRRL